MATRRRLEGTVPTILSICRCSLSPQSHRVSSLSQAAGEGHSTAVTGRLRSTKNSVSPGPSCLAKWRMSQGCCDSCRISWTNERYRWSWSVSRIGDRALMSRNPWCRCQRLALLPRLSLLPARTSLSRSEGTLVVPTNKSEKESPLSRVTTRLLWRLARSMTGAHSDC